MQANRQRIFHLEIDGEHHYFGSPKAMFDTLGEERLGMKYSSFHSNIHVPTGSTYKNRRNGWILRCGEIEKAKTNRNNKWQEIINAGIAKAISEQNVEAAKELATAPEPVVESPAPVIEATKEPIVTAEPMVETSEPAVEAPTETALEAPVAEAPIEKPVPKPKSRSKKKSADIPEQLTLF